MKKLLLFFLMTVPLVGQTFVLNPTRIVDNKTYRSIPMKVERAVSYTFVVSVLGQGNFSLRGRTVFNRDTSGYIIFDSIATTPGLTKYTYSLTGDSIQNVWLPDDAGSQGSAGEQYKTMAGWGLVFEIVTSSSNNATVSIIKSASLPVVILPQILNDTAAYVLHADSNRVQKGYVTMSYFLANSGSGGGSWPDSITVNSTKYPSMTLAATAPVRLSSSSGTFTYALGGDDSVRLSPTQRDISQGAKDSTTIGGTKSNAFTLQTPLRMSGSQISWGGDDSLRISQIERNKDLAGITWVDSSALGNNDWWQSVTFGNGLFVAVGNSGNNRIASSPDGINWTNRGLGTNAWRSVVYGNGKFVAVGSGDSVGMSIDGKSWTMQKIPSPIDWNSITYGNGIFVAVGYDDSVMTSINGTDWIMRAISPVTGTSWEGITFGNGLFVAVGAYNDGLSDAIMTSSDGITWTARTAPVANVYYMSVVYGKGKFVAVANYGSQLVAVSQNGITWTAQDILGNNDDWNSVAYGEGLFVAAGCATDYLATSTDGLTWTLRSASGSNICWEDVAYANGMFVGVGQGWANLSILNSGETKQTITPHDNIFQGDYDFRGNITTPIVSIGNDSALATNTSGTIVKKPFVSSESDPLAVKKADSASYSLGYVTKKSQTDTLNANVVRTESDPVYAAAASGLRLKSDTTKPAGTVTWTQARIEVRDTLDKAFTDTTGRNLAVQNISAGGGTNAQVLTNIGGAHVAWRDAGGVPDSVLQNWYRVTSNNWLRPVVKNGTDVIGADSIIAKGLVKIEDPNNSGRYVWIKVNSGGFEIVGSSGDAFWIGSSTMLLHSAPITIVGWQPRLRIASDNSAWSSTKDSSLTVGQPTEKQGVRVYGGVKVEGGVTSKDVTTTNLTATVGRIDSLVAGFIASDTIRTVTLDSLRYCIIAEKRPFGNHGRAGSITFRIMFTANPNEPRDFTVIADSSANIRLATYHCAGYAIRPAMTGDIGMWRHTKYHGTVGYDPAPANVGYNEMNPFTYQRRSPYIMEMRFKEANLCTAYIDLEVGYLQLTSAASTWKIKITENSP